MISSKNLLIQKLLIQKLVKEEAKNLLKFAKKKELKNLNFEKLDSNHVGLCVYGQITGDCFSARSSDLIVSCASRVYNITNNTDSLKYNKINGKPSIESRGKYFSPIEVFIYKKTNQKNGNNEMLIDYLKGNRKTLKFK